MHHTHPALWPIVAIALLAGTPRPAPATERAPPVDPGAGTLVLGPPDAGVEALLLDTRFALDVEGLLGELTLTQTFRNTTGDWLDGTYLFPLPEEAAVRGLELRVGERVVTGRVMERDEARETFEHARDAGRVAGLVEQQRPNLFTARLSSVPPGGEVRVALDVLLPVRASDERLSLTLPTTLVPRYVNAHADGPDELDGPILPAREIAGPRFTLEAILSPLADLSLASSPSHRLTIEGGRLAVRDAPMDRDLVIAWPFAGGAAPSGEAFGAIHLGERYVQLFMAPPAADAGEEARTARELVLVVDTSGSMAGTSIDAAREAAQSALDGLGPDDAFDLIAFDDETRALFDGPRRATSANLAAARRFVRRLNADGGTEMAPALARAFSPVRHDERRSTTRGDGHSDAPPSAARARERLDAPRSPTRDDEPAARTMDEGERDEAPTTRLRQIVFLTDGSIADEERLLALIRRDAGDARLFTVGIGAAPNTWFLDKAAELGRGTALAIRDVDDVRDAVTELLGRLERPVLTGIAVQFPDGGAESYPARVPDLYADSPLMIVARLDRDSASGSDPNVPDTDAESRVAIVTGWRGEERFVRRIALPAPSARTAPDADVDAGPGTDADMSADANADMDAATTPNTARGAAPSLAMHWARAKVATLLDEQRESRNGERHRADIVALALDVGLVTPYTSFVAVEREPTRPAGAERASAEVANLLPHGNEMTTFSLPRGAAGIDTLALLALLAALSGSAMLRLGRRLGRNASPGAPS